MQSSSICLYILRIFNNILIWCFLLMTFLSFVDTVINDVINLTSMSIHINLIEDDKISFTKKQFFSGRFVRNVTKVSLSFSTYTFAVKV